MYKNFAMWQQESQGMGSVLDDLSVNIEPGQAGHIDNHKKINEFLRNAQPKIEVLASHPAILFGKYPDGWSLIDGEQLTSATPEQVSQIIEQYSAYPVVVKDGLAQAIEYESLEDIPVGSSVNLITIPRGVARILEDSYSIGLLANTEALRLRTSLRASRNFDEIFFELLNLYCDTQIHERDPDTNEFVPPLPRTSNPNYLGITYYSGDSKQISYIRALHKSIMSSAVTTATSYILRPMVDESRASSLEADVASLVSTNSTLEATIADLTARLEALENPTSPE